MYHYVALIYWYQIFVPNTMLCNDHRWLDAIELSLAVHRRGYQHFAFLILFNIVYFYLVFINLIIIFFKKLMWTGKFTKFRLASHWRFEIRTLVTYIHWWCRQGFQINRFSNDRERKKESHPLTTAPTLCISTLPISIYHLLLSPCL